MKNKDQVYESVHNYTKYKLVEMLINRMNKGKLNLDNLNAIEDVADDVLRVLAICGMKYYQDLRGKFNEEI